LRSAHLLLVQGEIRRPSRRTLDAGTVIYEAEQLQRAFLAEETGVNRDAARNVFPLSEVRSSHRSPRRRAGELHSDPHRRGTLRAAST
jgi:hypothetical protein